GRGFVTLHVDGLAQQLDRLPGILLLEMQLAEQEQRAEMLRSAFQHLLVVLPGPVVLAALVRGDRRAEKAFDCIHPASAGLAVCPASYLCRIRPEGSRGSTRPRPEGRRNEIQI